MPLASLPPDWLGIVRETATRTNAKLRPHAVVHGIEVQCSDDRWALLEMPTGATAFETFQERDAALAEISSPNA